MRTRFGFLIGFGAGYVLGAKAGTQRYEQLKRLYDNLASSQSVRQARGRAKEAAGTGLGQAKDKAAESVSKVAGKVKERRSDEDADSRPGGLSVAPPPN
jgi:hypothetical protein